MKRGEFIKKTSLGAVATVVVGPMVVQSGETQILDKPIFPLNRWAAFETHKTFLDLEDSFFKRVLIEQKEILGVLLEDPTFKMFYIDTQTKGD